MQAGASDAGRDFAAATAEVVFTAQGDLDEATAFARDLRARCVKAGRSADALRILPGINLDEARELARLVQEAGIVAMAGTQARVAPEIQYLRQLITEGYVGEVLSTSLIGSGVILGPTVEPRSIYLMDRATGANMLTIPVGHMLSAVREVLGEATDLSARLVNRRHSARVEGTGEVRPMTAHDQVLMEGVLDGGAPISLHYRGGLSRGIGLLWEINGTEGDIQVTGTNGHAQMVQLILAGGRGDARVFQPIEIPASFYAGLPTTSLPATSPVSTPGWQRTYGTGRKRPPASTMPSSCIVCSWRWSDRRKTGCGLRLPVCNTGRSLRRRGR